MHDARDAEDRRLLEAREYKQLLAGYFHPVLERCFLRLRSEEHANDVAQMVFVRLLRELRAGRRYSVPFRVVVWNVTEWTLRGFFPAPKEDATLPDDWDPEAPDAYADWEDTHDFDLLIADLPPRQYEVLKLLHGEGLSPAQIGERLGITRNAVDQALHNGHRRLAEKLHA
jgi:RNA polymerase sigma factor (sigma-70 family)